MEQKRFPIIIATTLFAILLWVSVNMSYEYQIVVPVPLVIENLPPGEAIATPFPKTVQLKLRGNGWRSAALMLGTDPQCIVDASSLVSNKRPLGLNDIVDRITIPLGIQPVDMKPESVRFDFDRYSEKRVPVVLRVVTMFHPGYGQVGETAVIPDRITIGGAASLLATIERWPTAGTVFRDVRSPIDTDVPLVDSASHYLKLFPQKVRLRMNVQQFAEKTVVGLTVETNAVPPNKEVILIPPKIDIVVRGGVDQLAALSNENFGASINYDEIVEDSTGYAEPAVTSPRGVQLVAKRPERMQFVIRTRL